MSENPFQASPLAAEDDVTDAGIQVDESLERAAKALRLTKPWIRMLAILILLSGGLWLIASLLALAITLQIFGGSYFYLEDFIAALVSVAAAGLYTTLGVYLLRFATRISNFQQQLSMSTLANALESQRAFWRFCGIVAVIGMFGIILLAVLGVIEAVYYM